MFVTSEKLRQRAATLSERVHLFPFGVSFEGSSACARRGAAARRRRGDSPRPIVGYVGGLHQWVDQDLVAAVARGCPSVSIRARRTGADRHVGAADGRRTSHLLGQKPHAELPALRARRSTSASCRTG